MKLPQLQVEFDSVDTAKGVPMASSPVNITICLDSLVMVPFSCHVLNVVYELYIVIQVKLLPVTHVLVDMWMLTVKPVHKL